MREMMVTDLREVSRTSNNFPVVLLRRNSSTGGRPRLGGGRRPPPVEKDYAGACGTPRLLGASGGLTLFDVCDTSRRSVTHHFAHAGNRPRLSCGPCTVSGSLATVVRLNVGACALCVREGGGMCAVDALLIPQPPSTRNAFESNMIALVTQQQQGRARA